MAAMPDDSIQDPETTVSIPPTPSFAYRELLLAGAARVELRLVHHWTPGPAPKVERHVGDQLRHPRHVRIVDVLWFVGELVIRRVAAGGEEGDRDAPLGVLIVIAASVDVHRVFVRIHAVVEHQVVLLRRVHALHEITEFGG